MSPETIGQQITQGCVRMKNAEVEELYTILPLGTEVTIVD
jgi:lipoprotein-anchoring transpeptidase ErfK/SrfK